MSDKPSNPAVKPELPEAKPKKKRLPVFPGQQSHGSFKEAIKSIENTLGQMHLDAIKKGK